MSEIVFSDWEMAISHILKYYQIFKICSSTYSHKKLYYTHHKNERMLLVFNVVSPIHHLRWIFRSSVAQISHEPVVSPVWILICFVIALFWEKTLPQISQANGFLTIWTFIWIIKEDFQEKDLPHISQGNGVSPVCILIWESKLLLLQYFLSHIWQQNSFSSVNF